MTSVWAPLSKFAVALGVLLAAAWPGAAYSQSDADLLRFVREIADETSGRQVSGDLPADKLVEIGRDGNEPIVVGIAAVLRTQWVEPQPGVIALLRTRGSTPSNNRAPDPSDIAFVQRTGLRVFVVGEWATPPVIWEVARDQDHVRIREIDADGGPGQWRAGPG